MPRLLISSRKHKVFTDRKRKVYRKRISNGEVAFSVVFAVLVLGMAGWFAAQKDNFDPGERDISMATLVENTVVDTLYRTPLQRWTEPGRVSGTPQAAGPGAGELAPFPASILEGGWEPSSRLQAFDESTLYEKINGAAPQYVQFGFVKLHYISIAKTGTDHDISIELYNMGKFENALGIFAAQRDEDAAVLTDGNAHYYRTAVGALGIAGPYYFKLSGTSADPVILEKSDQLVRALATLAEQAGRAPRAFDVFAREFGIPFQDIEFEKSDVFQYDFAKEFWFGKAAPDSNLRYYVHEAADAEEAKALFDKLLENHLFDYDRTDAKGQPGTVGASESKVILKHKFLNTYLTLVRVDNLVFGIDGAAESGEANQATATLQAALLGEGDETEAYSAS